MKKVLGSWSGMRKYLEQEMLAECLHGRVRYNCTTFAGMDGCHLFSVYMDDKEIERFSWETVNTYFIDQGYKKEKSSTTGIAAYWEEFWPLLEEISLSDREKYTDGEFCEALERYRHQSIAESIASENPIVRMFAILDRRVGKRTLKALKASLANQPTWLQQFYQLRFEAQDI